MNCVHSFVRPTDSFSGFEVAKRVAWLLRGVGGGLLIKNSGGTGYGQGGCAVGARLRLAPYRLENCGALRALCRPAFLRST